MRRWWSAVHKWLGLIVGLQVLAWMVSGLYLTAVPINRVRSEHNIRKAEPLDLGTTAEAVLPAQAMPALQGRMTCLELGEMLRITGMPCRYRRQARGGHRRPLRGRAVTA